MAAKYCGNPSGVWETDDIIGSECKISGMPVGYDYREVKTGFFDADDTHIITGVLHRVDTEGHIVTVYQLEGIPERLFKATEIFITKIV